MIQDDHDLLKARWKPDDAFIEKFKSRLSPCPNTGCWFWTAGVSGPGYGIMSRGGRYGSGFSKTGPVMSHRMAYLIFVGDIGNKHVLHHCDNKLCCNPDHLYLGTDAENGADRKARNRIYRGGSPGQKNGWALLNDDKVRDIKTGRMSRKEFASLYGVSVACIDKIASGKNWTHIQ